MRQTETGRINPDVLGAGAGIVQRKIITVNKVHTNVCYLIHVANFYMNVPFHPNTLTIAGGVYSDVSYLQVDISYSKDNSSLSYASVSITLNMTDWIRISNLCIKKSAQ